MVAYTTYHRNHVFRSSLHWQSFRHIIFPNRFRHHEQFVEKPQETLDEHVAFAGFDSPFLIQCGASLSEAAIEDVITSIYYGDDKNGAPDPNMITYVEQFMLGLNKCKGLYTQSLQTGSNGASGEVLLSIPESYTVTRFSWCMLVTD